MISAVSRSMVAVTPFLLLAIAILSVEGFHGPLKLTAATAKRPTRGYLAASISGDFNPYQIQEGMNGAMMWAMMDVVIKGGDGILEHKEDTRGVRRGQSPNRHQTPEEPRAAWVLMFNGRQQDCGVYCLWSSGRNAVLAFEERDMALRYALQLEAQGFHMPGPNRVLSKDLHSFCQKHDFGLRIVPVGGVVLAPDRSKSHLEYDPREHVQSGSDVYKVQGSDSPLTSEDLNRWRDLMERLYGSKE